MLGRLHKLVVVVVQHAQHARPARLAEADQAALRQRRFFRAFIRRLASHVGLKALHLLLHDSSRILVGDLSVCGLDDVRGAPFALHSRQRIARRDPEAVIALETEIGAALLWSTLVRVGVGRAELRIVGRNAGKPGLLDDCLGLRVIDHQLGHAPVARQRRQRCVGPDAGQVRLAVCRARNLRQCWRRHGHRECDENRSDFPHEASPVIVAPTSWRCPPPATYSLSAGTEAFRNEK